MQTGEPYHHSITASPRDRRTRDSFLRAVLNALPPERRILDFGAGTGLDAKVYAAAGHRVSVYEPDDAQCAYLARYCREEIAHRVVIPSDFPPKEPVDAITADFAVLNLVPDPAALFEAFSQILAKDGFILASLLNPYFPGDMRYGWWRANLLTLLRGGQYTVGSAPQVTRYGPHRMARLAAPHFRLDRILSAGPVWWMRQYAFLLFRPS